MSVKLWLCLAVAGAAGVSRVTVCVCDTPAVAPGTPARQCHVSPAATRAALGASSPGLPHCPAFTDQPWAIAFVQKLTFFLFFFSLFKGFKFSSENS